jgi:hypothetical protein
MDKNLDSLHVPPLVAVRAVVFLTQEMRQVEMVVLAAVAEHTPALAVDR